MSNINRSGPVWLFDLDNTLHNASHAIFPAITANMNRYLARVLGDGVTPADAAAVDAARQLYWSRYGATLTGMVRHHGVCAADFLHETHQIGGLADLVRSERGLGRLLRALPGRKILFTNAPTRYSRDVMRHLGVQRHFSHHVAVEAMQVHRQMRPKPSKLMLRRLLRRQKLDAGRCILVEDTLANLRSAKALGLRTAWITQWLAPAPRALNRPAYVDVKVKSVRHLRARLHRLR
ncbi:MAG TPA: pyrimidine 5'-nucleotidase [Janthinobacterium sp.]|nr:pyrimidine 5'-nucleotidase [Janthinobacterium sp.]